MRSIEDAEIARDDPPAYEEVLKTEAPPPPYYMVVSEFFWPSTSDSANMGDKLHTKKIQQGIQEPHKHIHSDARVSTIFSPLPWEVCGEGDQGCSRCLEAAVASSTSTVMQQDPVGTIRVPIRTELGTVPTHLPTSPRRDSSSMVREATTRPMTVQP